MANKYLDETGVTYLWNKIKNEDYKSLYNLGYYDTITANSDGTYTITRQTGYLDSNDLLKASNITCDINNDYICRFDGLLNVSSGDFTFIICNLLPRSWSISVLNRFYVYDKSIYIKIDGLTTTEAYKQYVAQNNLFFQYKLTTSYTEKVEKNHYARYNQDFILEHNKSEAERSANVFDGLIELGSLDTSTGQENQASNRWRSKNYISVKPNTTYTISGFSGGPLIEYNTNKSFIKNKVASNNETFTTSSTTYYLRFYSDSNNTDIMLNEGDHPYPYQAYNQNKHITNNEASFLKTEYDKSTNLFDYDNAGWENNVSLSTSVGNLWNRSGSKVSKFVKVEPNKTYYIQNCALICCYNSNKEYLNQSFYINYYSVNNFSFTTPSNCEYIRIDTTIPTTQIMLNEGSEPLPYQPYEGKVVHEKELGGYVDIDSLQTITNYKKFTKGFNVGIRDDTGIFPYLEDGHRLLFKSYGSSVYFYCDNGSGNYTRRLQLIMPLGGTEVIYSITFPTKNGTIALTSDIPTFKTINGNSIVGSGDLTITADSVFTEVTDVIDSFIINKNGTWLITCLGYNKIYASDNSTISFYGSALVSMTSVGSDPHICINGTAYACSSAITFVTSGIMQVYKKAN